MVFRENLACQLLSCELVQARCQTFWRPAGRHIMETLWAREIRDTKSKSWRNSVPSHTQCLCIMMMPMTMPIVIRVMITILLATHAMKRIVRISASQCNSIFLFVLRPRLQLATPIMSRRPLPGQMSSACCGNINLR